MEPVIKLINKTPHPVKIYGSGYTKHGHRKGCRAFFTLDIKKNSVPLRVLTPNYFNRSAFLRYLLAGENRYSLISPIIESVRVSNAPDIGNIIVGKYTGRPLSAFLQESWKKSKQVRDIVRENPNFSGLNYDPPYIPGVYYVVSVITMAFCPRADFLTILGLYGDASRYGKPRIALGLSRHL